MFRFLFGGLATVAGIVLLFVASFGNPAAVLDRVSAVFGRDGSSPATISHSRTAAEVPAASFPPAIPQRKPQIAARIAPPPVAPEPPPNPTPATTPPAAKPAPALPADNSAVQAQRKALEQQIRQLHAEMQQASQSVVALQSQAAQQRQDLEQLQQQRAAAQQQRAAEQEQRVAEQQAVDRRQAAQATATAMQPPPAAAAASGSGAAASGSGSSPHQANVAANGAGTSAPAPTVQTADADPQLPLPPPAPPLPAPAPAPSAMATAASRAAPPLMRRNDRVAETDPDTLQSVLDRLRHREAGGPPPQQMTGRAQEWTSSRAAEPDPRRRLGLARAAIMSNNFDAARQYLEQAQLQLVFRPVTPYDDAVPGPSRAADDVASALGALGAGDGNGALAYLNRAMAEVRSAAEPAPQSYGYAGPGYRYPESFGSTPGNR